MLSRRRLLLGAAAMAGALAVRPAPAAAATGVAAAVWDRVNGHRSAHGLGPLVEDHHLSAVSAGWSAAMAGGRGLAHNGDRDAQYGWPVHDSGEVVGYAGGGGRTPAQLGVQIADAWMASSSHRAIILGGHWTDAGVGVATDGAGRLWATINTIVADLPAPGAEALALSRAFLPAGTAPRVVLARVDAHTDALVAAALAGGDAPLLLVRPGQPLPPSALAEVDRVAAAGGVAHLVGSGLDGALDQQLGQVGLRVRRTIGDSRYTTAAAVAREVRAVRGTPARLWVANAGQWPDAVVIAGAAARNGEPILLTDAAQAPAATLAARRSLGDVPAVVVGGPAVVSDAVVASLEAGRLGSTDRAGTSAEAMRLVWGRGPGQPGDHLVLTPGWAPDGWGTALAHATFSARFRAPVLFTADGGLPGPVRDALSAAGYAAATRPHLQFARGVSRAARDQATVLVG